MLRGRARRAQELTELELPTGELIRSTDPAEGDAVAIVYPWEVTLSRTSPDDSAQNHITGVVASLVPVGNRVRARVGPLTAEITTDSSERLGLQVGGDIAGDGRLRDVRRGDAHGGDQPGVQVAQHMPLVAVEQDRAGFAAVAHLGIFDADAPVFGHPAQQRRRRAG